MKFAIIVPSKRSDNLTACVAAIRAHEENPRIIVIDDGLTESPEGIDLLMGESPFCFARNVNIGIRAAGELDCLLLNDDVQLQTPRGFSMMSELSEGWGVLAPRTNVSGNPNQTRIRHDEDIWEEPSRCVPFLCAYIPRVTINAVGLLDERFQCYGFEDMDFCRRTRLAGLKTGIFRDCFVDHGSLTSTYRGDPRTPANLEPGKMIYLDKWGDLN